MNDDGIVAMFPLFVWTSTWCFIVYIILFCDICAVDRNISYYRGGTLFEAPAADMPSGNLKLGELGFTAKSWKHWITWIVKSACFVSVAAQVKLLSCNNVDSYYCCWQADGEQLHYISKFDSENYAFPLMQWHALQLNQRKSISLQLCWCMSMMFL